MKKWVNSLLIDLTALLFGIALSFAFAPYEIFPLAIISPAVLLILWLPAPPKRAGWLGFVFGLGLFGAGVHWVFHSIHVFGEVPALLAAVMTGGLIAILALFPAAVGYTSNRYFPSPDSARVIYVYPATWVFSEWIRSWLFTGFPWLFLGYSQTNSPLKGYAPFLSVYGVSLAVVLSSALLVNASRQFKQKSYQSAYLNLLIFIVIWISGGLFSLIPWTRPNGAPLSVSLVQGDIPQAIKWSPEHIQLSLDRYEKMTQPLWQKGRLIIWPEAAIPLSLTEAAHFIEFLDVKAKANDAHLILGIPIPTTDHTGFYNAIVTLGQTKQVYLKRHLVPFGEYIPTLPLLSSALNVLNIPLSNLVPGKLIQAPFIFDQVKILTSICYEIAFPELIYTNDRTIGLLLTITNDAWFGQSAAQAQHLQMAMMRAIELQRPLLFASNDGITAIIGADGNIEAAAPIRQPAVLTGMIQPVYGLTPWMRNGIDPLLFILIVLIVMGKRANKRFIQAAADTATNAQPLSMPLNENKK